MRPAGSVEVERRVPAAIDEVFRWWTEPERLRQWMSPVGSAEAVVDLRVGGGFRVVMKGEGMVIEHTGEYLEIDPPRRLVFTWQSPYTGAEGSLVTVDLEPDGDGTRVRLVHSRLSEAAAASHRGGWAAMLERLTGNLAAASRGA